EHTGFLLLIGTLESEGGNVGARWHLNVADLNVIQALGDNLPQRFFWINIGPVLANIRDLDRVDDLQITGGDLFESHNCAEQGDLPSTVWTNDAHAAVGWHRRAQVVNESAPGKALGTVLGFNDLGPQARSRWDLDFFEVQHTSFLGFGCHVFVAFQTGLLLGLAAFGIGTYPVELVLEATRKFGVLLALNSQTFLFLFQVGRVVTLIW